MINTIVLSNNSDGHYSRTRKLTIVNSYGFKTTSRSIISNFHNHM